MTVARLAISLDPKLANAVKKAAGSEPVSAWIAEAIERRLRSEGLARVVDAWERVHGALREDDLAAADWQREMPRAAPRRRVATARKPAGKNKP